SQSVRAGQRLPLVGAFARPACSARHAERLDHRPRTAHLAAHQQSLHSVYIYCAVRPGRQRGGRVATRPRLHAALRSGGDTGTLLGGIGLVFDSEVELSAMLDGALAGKPHSHACYVDRQGRVIAASSASGVSVGARLPFELPADMWSVECGSSACRLVEHADELFVVACCASSGYREFKRSDGYRDEVLAIMWQALGTAEPQTDVVGVPLNAEPASSEGDPYAIFVCAGRLYAVSASKVQEARAADAMLPMTLGGGANCVGMLTMTTDSSRALAYVYNLAAWLGDGENRKSGREIVVLNDDGIRIGLLVDQLHSVGRHIARPLHRTTIEGFMVSEVLQVAGALIPVLDTEALLLQRSRTLRQA